jgi:hypothetical protein
LVHITQVAGFNNYDNCRFLDEKMPVMIGGEKMQKSQESLAKIKEYLETSPDLTAYDYQEWDQQTEDFVNGVIRNTVPGGRMIESVEKSNRTSVASTPVTKADPAPVAKTSALPNLGTDLGNLDDIDDLNTSSFDDELYGSL